MVLTDRSPVHDWLRQAVKDGSIVFSVCTGAYVLAQAGLLDGREATSLHAQLDLLKQLAPTALVRGDLPFVVSGEVITAAGAGTAFEASLYIVEQLAGEASADYLASDYLDYVRYESR